MGRVPGLSGRHQVVLDVLAVARHRVVRVEGVTDAGPPPLVLKRLEPSRRLSLAINYRTDDARSFGPALVVQHPSGV
jgi:hypothetical protein